MNACLEERNVRCPECGEAFTALLDLSAGDRRYIEDCPVCCMPIEFRLQYDDRSQAFKLTLHGT